MDWPKDGSPAKYADIIEPLMEAFKVGATWRIKAPADRDIPWAGLPITRTANILTPDERLSAGGRKYDSDKGRSFLCVMFEIAVQLGIEQGMRLEREGNKTTVDLLDAVAAHFHGTVKTLCMRHGITSRLDRDTDRRASDQGNTDRAPEAGGLES
jgi:hypothetical protein